MPYLQNKNTTHLAASGANKTVLANNVEAKLPISAEKRDERTQGSSLNFLVNCLVTYRREAYASEKTGTV